MAGVRGERIRRRVLGFRAGVRASLLPCEQPSPWLYIWRWPRPSSLVAHVG
jgi:hypothetical protein